jgi:YD repeat-containing protein
MVLVVAALGRVFASATPPAQTAAPAAVCRNYSTDATQKATRFTLQVKCAFDKGTLQHVCTENGPGVSYVQTTQFASVADFVGDPSKVTFFPHAKTITVKFPTSISNQVYAYDGQGRVTSIATSSSTGGGTVQVFTAWDALGRPTAAHDEVQTFTFAYDDARRVFTHTSTGKPALITATFDANGNQIATTTTSAGFNETSTITIHSTAQVCK